METSCKQVSWCPFSEEESMTSKEEESSSCSLMHNLMSINCNRMQDEECSMCGDVGLPQYLFKCLTCTHRYQHIYCSKFYPYRIEATICNWCLPMEQLVNNTLAEVDDTKDMKVSNLYSDRNTKPDIDANSNYQIDQQVQKLEKHTKAFEYLLQVAELHDQGHQWDNPAARPIEEFSEKNCVGHCQNSEICKFYEVGHIAKELNNQEPAASLMMHQFIISGCSNDQDRSFYTIRGGDKIDYLKGPSTISTQLQYSHSHGHDQIGMNQDIVGNSQIKKNTLCQDLGHDQIMKKLNYQGLGHNQTIKKLNDQLDQVHVRQELAIRPVKDQHEIGCSDSDDRSLKLQDASAVKRARLHKQLQAAVGGNSHSINAADEQKMYSQAAYNVCSGDSDQQLAGKLCDNTGSAKRPRHRQSGAQVIAGDNYVLNPAIRQRAVAGNNDQANTSAADQHRVLGINQSSAAHAWSRPAGKRDHLMNSPSRAINRRYKLLADVLC